MNLCLLQQNKQKDPFALTQISHSKTIGLGNRDEKKRDRSIRSMKLSLLQSPQKIENTLDISQKESASPQCNNYCGFNIKQTQPNRSEICFDNMDELSENHSTFIQTSTRFSKYSSAKDSNFQVPPTPISKIFDIEKDVEKQRRKSKGIRVSSLKKGNQKLDEIDQRKVRPLSKKFFSAN